MLDFRACLDVCLAFLVKVEHEQMARGCAHHLIGA